MLTAYLGITFVFMASLFWCFKNDSEEMSRPAALFLFVLIIIAGFAWPLFAIGGAIASLVKQRRRKKLLQERAERVTILLQNQTVIPSTCETEGNN